MPKDRRVHSLSFDRSRASPYPCSSNNVKQCKPENPSGSVEDVKEWEEARCPICMEHPHNAVLLKCSSYEKGCRPYMCNTSYRHSNCLDQFCKSSVSSPSTANLQEFSPASTISHRMRDEWPLPRQTRPSGDQLQPKLLCPLCRGEIYGWIVVESARQLMNSKARSCSCETCDFSGTYSELRKHARSEHPYIWPTEVDPARQHDWTRMERERDFDDVLSSIQSAMGEERTEDDLLSSEFSNYWLTIDLLDMLFSPLFEPLFETLGGSRGRERQGGSRGGEQQVHNGRLRRTSRVSYDMEPPRRGRERQGDSRGGEQQVHNRRLRRTSRVSYDMEPPRPTRWRNNLPSETLNRDQRLRGRDQSWSTANHDRSRNQRRSTANHDRQRNQRWSTFNNDR